MTLMNIHDLQELVGLGRSATYKLTMTVDFPAPYAISGKALRWDEAEVMAWLQSQKVKNPSDRIRRAKVESRGVITVNGVKFRKPQNV